MSARYFTREKASLTTALLVLLILIQNGAGRAANDLDIQASADDAADYDVRFPAAFQPLHPLRMLAKRQNCKCTADQT